MRRRLIGFLVVDSCSEEPQALSADGVLSRRGDGAGRRAAYVFESRREARAAMARYRRCGLTGAFVIVPLESGEVDRIEMVQG